MAVIRNELAFPVRMIEARFFEEGHWGFWYVRYLQEVRQTGHQLSQV
jgi:hypothetical protein